MDYDMESFMVGLQTGLRLGRVSLWRPTPTPTPPVPPTPPTPSDYMITETADRMITESGDYMVTE